MDPKLEISTTWGKEIPLSSPKQEEPIEIEFPSPGTEKKSLPSLKGRVHFIEDKIDVPQVKEQELKKMTPDEILASEYKPQKPLDTSKVKAVLDRLENPLPVVHEQKLGPVILADEYNKPLDLPPPEKKNKL